MTNVHFEWKLRRDYLFVKTVGKRGTFFESVTASAELAEIIRKSKSRYILADYRDVVYDLGNSELFSVTRFIEQKQPELKEAVMAVVVGDGFVKTADYWSEIFKQRGFNIIPFQDMNEARDWLQEMKEHSDS